MIGDPLARRGQPPSKRRRARRFRTLVALATIGIAAILGVYFLNGSPLAVQKGATMIRPASDVSSVRIHLMGSFGAEFAGEMLAVRSASQKGDVRRFQLREGVNSEEAIASVANGDDMIGVARADSFLEARGKGVPIVAFAASFIESPVAFYVLKRSGLRGAQDFAQMWIGRRVGDDTEVSFDALVAKLGLPRSTMHEVPVRSDVAMLTRGDVEVWPGHVGKDDYALTKLGSDYVAVDPGSYGVRLPGSVYFASERTLQEHPQLILNFLRNVIAGWGLAYADTSLSAPMIAAFDYERLTPDSVRFALERQRDSVRPISARYCEFDELHWRSLQEILLRQRLLDQPVDLSLAVNYQFLKEAYRKLITFGK